MSFSSQHLLFLIPVLLIIWYLFLREKIGYKIPNPFIARYLRTPPSVYVLWIFRGVILFFLIGMIAGPYSTSLIKVTKQESSHTLILLDISRSMLAEDIAPNRLSGAKKTIRTFLEGRKNDMIGLIVFAGKPFLSLPFSLDYSGIRAFVSGVSPDFIAQEKEGLSGTAIGDAIILANMSFSGTSDRGAIILVTDGRANIGIDPRIAVEETAQLHIPIYTIGIGSSSGGELYYTDPNTRKRVYFYDESGSILTSDIDETLMREIAEKTGGQYYRAENMSELEQHFSEIDAATTNPEHTEIETRTVHYEPIFLILAMTTLLIETYWKRHIWRKYKLL